MGMKTSGSSAAPEQIAPRLRSASLSSPGRAGGLRIAIFSHAWANQAQDIQIGGSDYWRLIVPAAELKKQGHDVMLARAVGFKADGTMSIRDQHGTWWSDREIVIWRQWMSDDTAGWIRKARSTGQVIINDVDDYYWAIPKGHVANRGTDPVAHASFNRDHYRDTIKASTLITVATPWLANALARWGPPVETVRNYINLDDWKPRKPGRYIGWVGANRWRGADLQLLRPIIPWLAQHNETFYHGGHMNADKSASAILGYGNVTVNPAVEIGSYPSLWRPLRTALCPIENSSFGLAKSWVKSLEACARGIPFIASDHPAYRELQARRLVKKPGDWWRHLNELQDPDVHAAESERNRTIAEQYSIANNWQHWDQVLRYALTLA